jgi:predicted  nucleic acid-binding Zn-ribbon protein
MYLRVDNNETEEREFSKRKEVGEVADANVKNDNRYSAYPSSLA